MATESYSVNAYELESSASALAGMENLEKHSEWSDSAGKRLVADSFAVSAGFAIARANNRTGARRLMDLMQELRGGRVEYSKAEPGAMLVIDLSSGNTEQGTARDYVVYDMRVVSGDGYAVRFEPDGSSIVNHAGPMTKDTIIDVPPGSVLTQYLLYKHQGKQNISIENEHQPEPEQRAVYEEITSAIDTSKRRNSKVRSVLGKIISLLVGAK
ncbi:hypothetical protein JNM87_04885 [Candidatus Saccharibacteria bacterium]|nr:hypothetical protein [Candidatus Saccharibacteria bacterium]